MNKNLIGKWWVARTTRGDKKFTSAVKQKEPIEEVNLGAFRGHKASPNRSSNWLDIGNLEDVESKLHIKSVELPFTADYFDHDGIYEVDILPSGNWYVSDYVGHN